MANQRIIIDRVVRAKLLTVWSGGLELNYRVNSDSKWSLSRLKCYFGPRNGTYSRVHNFLLTYNTEIVSEAPSLTCAKVHSTSVHSLVVTFHILEANVIVFELK